MIQGTNLNTAVDVAEIAQAIADSTLAQASARPGIDFAKNLPNVSSLVGDTQSTLDSITTVGLPDNYWTSFRDANGNTQNYYFKIGALPDGGLPKYVPPADMNLSGGYWQQG